MLERQDINWNSIAAHAEFLLDINGDIASHSVWSDESIHPYIISGFAI